MLLGIGLSQSMHASSLGTLRASRPTAYFLRCDGSVQCSELK